MRIIISNILQVSLALLGLIITKQSSVLAQISTDGTVNTQINQNGNVTEITGGETRGSNLFHSFQDFSVPVNNEAFFDNASDISNIFSRVTGENISNIDGIIRANGNASLFLINPAGITFGSGARLDIGGSFYGSSASSVLFEDGEFSAVNLDAPPLLTINAPIGLSFRDNPGDINSNQSTLLINSQQTLGLIGGNLRFDSARLGGLGSNVELGGLTESGIVNINNDGSLDFSSAAVKGDISLAASLVFVPGDEGGSIDINAQNLSLASGSSLSAGIGVDSGSSEAQAGDIVINLTEDLTVNNSNIRNANTGSGNAGNVIVNARNISFNNGGQIFNFNNGSGNLGDTIITATGNIIFDGTADNFFSGITNFFTEEANGDVGKINLTAQNLTLTNGANIASRVEANNNSGDINLNIADTIRIEGSALVTRTDGTQTEFFSTLESILGDGNGNSGNINIDTTKIFLNEGLIQTNNLGQGSSGDINLNLDSLSITEGGRISSDIFGAGDGGNITINAQDTVSVAGNTDFFSVIRTDIAPDATGEAGNIKINTRKLTAQDAFISADVFGNGNGGTIDISTTDSIELSNLSLIQANVSIGSGGNGGNLNLQTKQLKLNDGSQISASTSGNGDAGTISINVSESINLSGVGELSRGGIFASALIDSGNGGDINLTTDRLTISDGAIITASNFPSFRGENTVTTPGTGEPGNISIIANSLNLDSEGRIEAITQAETGTGANIDLQVADRIFLMDNNFISAEALGNANGGNLTIDTDFIVAFPDGNNDIIANAQQGQGGNISINAEAILGIQERELSNLTNDINASSEFSLDGNVNITTPDLNPIQGTTELPRNVIDTGETTAQACNSDRHKAGTGTNSFVLSGRGGIAPSPATPLSSGNALIEGEVDSHTSAMPQVIETSQGKIQPARGIKISELGEVILTAYQTENRVKRLPQIKRNCRV